MTKLNSITTFHTCQGWESFLLYPGTIDLSLIPIFKVVSTLKPPKNVYYSIYMRRLAVKHPLICVNCGLICNFFFHQVARKRCRQSRTKCEFLGFFTKIMFTILLYMERLALKHPPPPPYFSKQWPDRRFSLWVTFWSDECFPAIRGDIIRKERNLKMLM